MAGSVARPPSLGAWLAQQIAEQIIDGTLAGGERLLETELATQYKLSRAPVRDALRMLAVDRLVDILPHRGAVVRPLTAQDIDEFYVCLAALSGTVMRLGAPRLTEADLGQLRTWHGRIEAAALIDNGKVYLEAWDQFSAIVARAAGNALLLDLLQQLDKQKRRYRTLLVATPGRIHTIVHTRIDPLLDALERRDPDAAEQRAREIAEGARVALLDILAAGPPATTHHPRCRECGSAMHAGHAVN